MRRIALFIAVVSGCAAPTEPERDIEVQIRVQGTITAAHDGTVIEGAHVQVLGPYFLPSGSLTHVTFEQVTIPRAEANSDAAGHYSLSFVQSGFCNEHLFGIEAGAAGFQGVRFEGVGGPGHIRCTDEVQTIDLQLEPAWMDARLTGVWGTSSNDVYAVGYYGAILHYDGFEGSAMTSGASEGPRSVWGASPSDVCAVGDNGTILTTGPDGQAWRSADGGPTGGPGSCFRSPAG